MNLKNKSCIVTGAARGIGEAIARRFVESGAHVAIADLRPNDARRTAERLTAMGPAARSASRWT